MNKIEALKKSIDQWERMVIISRTKYFSSIETLKSLALIEMGVGFYDRPHANCFLCEYAQREGKPCENGCPMYGYWPSFNNKEPFQKICLSEYSVFTEIFTEAKNGRELTESIEIILNAMKDRLKQLEGE